MPIQKSGVSAGTLNHKAMLVDYAARGASVPIGEGWLLTGITRHQPHLLERKADFSHSPALSAPPASHVRLPHQCQLQALGGVCCPAPRVPLAELLSAPLSYHTKPFKSKATPSGLPFDHHHFLPCNLCFLPIIPFRELESPRNYTKGLLLLLFSHHRTQHILESITL